MWDRADICGEMFCDHILPQHVGSKHYWENIPLGEAALDAWGFREQQTRALEKQDPREGAQGDPIYTEWDRGNQSNLGLGLGQTFQ